MLKNFGKFKNECQVQGFLEGQMLMNTPYGLSYPSIVASGLLALLLGILVSLEMATIEIVFVLTFLQGTGLAFDLPARQGLVNLLVKKEDLSSAIALNTTCLLYTSPSPRDS